VSSRLDAIASSGSDADGPPWLATGDAAVSYDPLSSHGIASALGAGYYAGCAARDHLLGRSEAFDAYRAVMQQAYATYLDLRQRAYADEQRWPDAPFWRRRHEVT
ncbi:MAG: hypothetical protein AAF772_19210, partial [Acidobacteriota bacterium]